MADTPQSDGFPHMRVVLLSCREIPQIGFLRTPCCVFVANIPSYWDARRQTLIWTTNLTQCAQPAVVLEVGYLALWERIRLVVYQISTSGLYVRGGLFCPARCDNQSCSRSSGRLSIRPRGLQAGGVSLRLRRSPGWVSLLLVDCWSMMVKICWEWARPSVGITCNLSMHWSIEEITSLTASKCFPWQWSYHCWVLFIAHEFTLSKKARHFVTK